VGAAARRSLEEFERQYILEVLERCGWKIKGRGHAADVLDLNPSTLRSKLKKLGIRRPPPSP
jgi:transcriptional regulator with GAF, ATPase, and Fis domain